MNSHVIFFLLCISYTYGLDNFFLGHYDGYDIPPPPTDREINTLEVSTNFLIQVLDHFDATNTNRFYQRYYVNTRFYNACESNAVFLLIGGEAQASIQWMNYGSWLESASKYKALMFQLEHRYYGQSQPYTTWATSNLRYLSSQQALEDITTFIIAMNKEYNLPPHVKWIVFGGSYSGSLAVWARQKYPHLVQGAVASSGPIFAKLDFYEYLEVVARALETHSQQCANDVQTAFEQLENLVTNPGQENVTALLNLCFDFDDETNRIENNIAYIFERITSAISGVVQYTGIPGQTSLGTICNILTNNTYGDRPIDRLAYLTRAMYSNCLNYRFQALVNGLSSTTVTANGNARQWYFQTCTEYGWYQSTSQEKKVFGNRNPVEFFTQLCSTVYGSHFNDDFIAGQIDSINRHYGGFEGNVSNIVHVQGSLDPWYPMGLTETINPESPAIFINGTSHCANLYNASVNDLPQLTAARREIDRLIGVWLGVSSALRIEFSMMILVVGLLVKLL